MKKLRIFLGLAAFAVAVFYACGENQFVPHCSDEHPEFCTEPIGGGHSSPSEPYSSSLYTGGDFSSSSVDEPGSEVSSPSSISSSSYAAAAVSSSSAARSSSSAQAATNSCDYKSIWCGGIERTDVTNISVTGQAPDGPACIFAISISKLGNENGQGGGLRVNGTKLTGNNGVDVGGRCGNTDWGQQTCSVALNSVAKADGGYYIYVPSWAGDFVTVGGTPTCNTNPIPQPTSSASVVRSSSSTGNIGGVSSSTGNSGGTSSAGGTGTSSAGGTGTLSCGSVASTGMLGQPVAKPTVTCNGSTVTGSAIQWTPTTLDWNSPAAGTYSNIKASVNVGTCGGLTANCSGTLTISTPSSSSIPPVGDVPNLGRLQQGQSGVTNGTTTRYWDACKPSCAWPGKTSENGVAKSCDVRGATIGNNTASACGGGSAFTCMNQAPWRMNDTVSYGFAAATTDGDCGKCFHIQFTNTAIQGKHMVVMISNIGGDVKQGAFDMMIPGGGVGQFNALSNQVSQLGGSSSNLGSQYGGFRATCGNNADCVRKMCNDTFSDSRLADLKAGCLWYVDWFQIADNPNTLVQKINCPQDLINRFK